MLLIDAMNIRGGGGQVLLDYLEAELVNRGVEFFIVDNNSCSVNGSKGLIQRTVRYFNRSKVLDEFIAIHSPETMLCFGNFPPNKFYPDIRIVTFFQNQLLLRNASLSGFGVLQKLSMYLKRAYLKKNVKHSDQYLFQIDEVRDEFTRSYCVDLENCLLAPFFDSRKVLEIKNQECRQVEKGRGAFIYPSSFSPHKNHYRLIKAWESLLIEKNLTPVLYLTVPKNPESKKLSAMIEGLNSKGGQIRNLENIPHAQLLKKMYECEFMIFPSLYETLGLGLLEGVLMENKLLINKNLNYKSILKPSLVFDGDDSSSIGEAVYLALTSDLEDSVLLLDSSIDKFIDSIH